MDREVESSISRRGAGISCQKSFGSSTSGGKLVGRERAVPSHGQDPTNAVQTTIRIKSPRLKSPIMATSLTRCVRTRNSSVPGKTAAEHSPSSCRVAGRRIFEKESNRAAAMVDFPNRLNVNDGRSALLRQSSKEAITRCMIVSQSASPVNYQRPISATFFSWRNTLKGSHIKIVFAGRQVVGLERVMLRRAPDCGLCRPGASAPPGRR